MAQGFIDSATLFEVVTYARCDEADTDWASRGSETATSALLFTHNLRVPRSPIRSGESSGPYRVLMSGIESLGTSLSADFHDASGVATERTRSWAHAHASVVADVMHELETDPKFHRWRESEITWAWPEYARRMNGLFTSVYIPELAAILKIPIADLSQLHRRTLEQHFVQQVIDTRPRKMIDLLSRAYLAATLLRGRYYCELARFSGQQLLQHPLRTAEAAQQITADLFKPASYRFACSLAETFFAKLLITSMFTERKLDRRISLWLENVARARPALLNPNSEQRKVLRTHVARTQVALDRAVAVAKYLNIRTYPQYIEEAVDVAIGTGVSAVTSFALQPWLAFAAGLGSVLVARRGLTRALTNIYANRRGRLERLALGPAGSVSRLGV